MEQEDISKWSSVLNEARCSFDPVARNSAITSREWGHFPRPTGQEKGSNFAFPRRTVGWKALKWGDLLPRPSERA